MCLVVMISPVLNEHTPEAIVGEMKSGVLLVPFFLFAFSLLKEDLAIRWDMCGESNDVRCTPTSCRKGTRMKAWLLNSTKVPGQPQRPKEMVCVVG